MRLQFLLFLGTVLNFVTIWACLATFLLIVFAAWIIFLYHCLKKCDSRSRQLHGFAWQMVEDEPQLKEMTDELLPHEDITNAHMQHENTTIPSSVEERTSRVPAKKSKTEKKTKVSSPHQRKLPVIVTEVNMKSPDEKLLERVMAVINKNIGNSDIKIEDIAKEVGLSRVHLYRKMKELTGLSPQELIRELRMKNAAHLLEKHRMNISEVMYTCGFNNPASFSTGFKHIYGLSPREYMRQHQ